ncbi:MAG: glycosyltransferase [Desulfobulbaceae bacterium]|nr:glycosyltransferase [Desulfobulbaceae bacterium]
MDAYFFWLAAITLFFLLVCGLEGLRGARKIAWLDSVSPLEGKDLPLVSVIIPALNEEENIREALSSVLALDYPNLEILAVNDRSTDSTGDILDEMAHHYPRLKVIHLKTLPPGWLGKSHALYRGAQQAGGRYLLFTDADVVMERSTLRRALKRMLEQNADHLTLFFKAVLPSSILQMVVIEFGAALVSFLKPWKAADPKSACSIGIGAFNLVRAEAYRNAGGHERIRLCPLDDIMLGRLLKDQGGRQECLYGYHFISVKWYGSLSEMTRGLMKNTFAALEYSFLRLCILTIIQLAVSIWPVWALLVTDGAVFLINLLIVLLQGLFFVIAALFAGISPFHAVWFPITPYILLYMTWKAVLSTLFHGGIVWRDTFYPLTDLKAERYLPKVPSKR